MAEPVSVRSRLAVDGLLADLRATYGDFPVSTETVPNSPKRFERGRAYAEAGGRGGAGARVTDDDGRLLLIRLPDAPDRWTHPGGAHEPGESLVAAAEREVREETGVTCEITGVWAALRRRFVVEGDPERRG